MAYIATPSSTALVSVDNENSSVLAIFMKIVLKNDVKIFCHHSFSSFFLFENSNSSLVSFKDEFSKRPAERIPFKGSIQFGFGLIPCISHDLGMPQTRGSRCCCYANSNGG